MMNEKKLQLCDEQLETVSGGIEDTALERAIGTLVDSFFANHGLKLSKTVRADCVAAVAAQYTPGCDLASVINQVCAAYIK